MKEEDKFIERSSRLYLLFFFYGIDFSEGIKKNGEGGGIIEKWFTGFVGCGFVDVAIILGLVLFVWWEEVRLREGKEKEEKEKRRNYFKFIESNRIYLFLFVNLFYRYSRKW